MHRNVVVVVTLCSFHVNYMSYEQPDNRDGQHDRKTSVYFNHEHKRRAGFSSSVSTRTHQSGGPILRSTSSMSSSDDDNKIATQQQQHSHRSAVQRHCDFLPGHILLAGRLAGLVYAFCLGCWPLFYYQCTHNTHAQTNG